jgi:hypothetical protein
MDTLIGVVVGWLLLEYFPINLISSNSIHLEISLFSMGSESSILIEGTLLLDAVTIEKSIEAYFLQVPL